MENSRWPVEGAVLRTRLRRVPAPESQPLQGYLGRIPPKGSHFASGLLAFIQQTWVLRPPPPTDGERQCLPELGTLSTPGV